MNTVLFFSPHLDDAVFSCAGAIQRTVAAGKRALLATVFSHGGREHVARRAEDRNALAMLGAEACWLGLRDAPWRSRYYRGFREIVLGAAPRDSHEAVFEALHTLIKAERPEEIFAPLGVGTHIDHRLVFDAVRALSGQSVRFYEERPYAFAAGSVPLRLRQLGCRTKPFSKAAFLASFRRLPHVREYLPPGTARRECESLILAQADAPEPRAIGANPSVLELTEQESRLARRAASAYVSQRAAFCGSVAAWARRERLHARSLHCRASRAERYWTLSEYENTDPRRYPK